MIIVLWRITRAAALQHVIHLTDYQKDMGELKPDSVVTMHIVVRPAQGQNYKQQGKLCVAKSFCSTAARLCCILGHCLLYLAVNVPFSIV